MTKKSAHRSGTGLVFSDDFLRHNAELSHPENPARLHALVEGLKAEGSWSLLTHVDFTEATDDEITRVHAPDYLRLLKRCEGQYLDADTYVGVDSPRIARLAAGGVIAAARAVWRGELANAFCAVRPPGHHALPERGMGFCLLNNVAVAAADLTATAPEARILIVDWDVHHGNGTQAIFIESPAVMYASIHQYPYYPGTGAATDVGHGSGRGFTINKPLRAGAGDEEFLGALDFILTGPAADFRPDFVFVSAGFDAHRDDPLAMLNVTTEGFAAATRRVCAFAHSACAGKLVSVLEGGYDLEALKDSASAHVAVLLEYGRRGTRRVGNDEAICTV